MWDVSTLVHFSGGTWGTVSGPDSGCPVVEPAVPLNAIWGRASDAVWGVGGNPGDGGVLYYDGSSWTVETSGLPSALKAVYGCSSDLWAVGENGAIYRRGSSGWAPETSPTSQDLNGVWCHSSTAAWAVGDAGTVLSWDGNSWSQQAVPTSADLLGVWGRSPTAVWVVGPPGAVLRHN